MVTATTSRKFTPEDLLKLPKDGPRYELVDGCLVEKPMSAISQWIASRIVALLNLWCAKSQRGEVVAEADFRCFPDEPGKVRVPDVAYLSNESLEGEVLDHGHFRMAPDIAIEVISPTNSLFEIDRKRADFLAAGVRQVWIVNPDLQSIQVYRPDGTISECRGEGEFVADEDVLPGFRCKLAEVFALPGQKKS